MFLNNITHIFTYFSFICIKKNTNNIHNILLPNGFLSFELKIFLNFRVCLDRTYFAEIKN